MNASRIPAAAVGGGLPALREVQVQPGQSPASRPPAPGLPQRGGEALPARWAHAPASRSPPPAPTVELEVADALALSVSGRGAAEAAPQGLTLAARRPPAAGERHRQQPQGSHPPPLPRGTYTRALTACGRFPHVGSRGRGRREQDRRPGPAHGRLTTYVAGPSATSQAHPPIRGRDGRDVWRRASHHSPACRLVPAFFTETRKDVASGYGKSLDLCRLHAWYYCACARLQRTFQGVCRVLEELRRSARWHRFW